jgi:uncharacterized protein (TIGR02271 family)
MLKKDVPSKVDGKHSRGIVTGGLIGGIIGVITASLYRIGMLAVPGLAPALGIIPLGPIISGTVLGIFIGAFIGGIITFYIFQSKSHQYDLDTNNVTTKKKATDNRDGIAKMQLREEQLDISKEKVQIGGVNMHKETFTEEKNITIPVTREELVIEKTVLDSGSHNKAEAHTEIIRIPISDERIDISKHKVELENVSVYNHKYQEKKNITETLKKETVKISTTGSAKVANEKISKNNKL